MTAAAEQRIRAAAAELGNALIDALRESGAPAGPERLLSVTEAAEAAGIGRTALYGALASGRIRSVRVGRRRLVPQSAIAELGNRPPEAA